MTSIVSIGTAVPAHKYQQEEIAEFMVTSLGGRGNGLERKIKALYGRSGIQTRHSSIPDYRLGVDDPQLMTNLKGQLTQPSVEERLRIFRKEAFPLAKEAIENCLDEASHNAGEEISTDSITHFISVSCTGLSAPGLEIEIPEKMNFRSDVTRFAVNFIGCYAAFHGMKMADFICKADPGARVLVVCTELCTLHFQGTQSKDDLVANSLFADGAAAILITGEGHQQFKQKISIDTFTTQVVPEGKNDMAWEISSKGFLMTLTSYIPSLVKNGIRPLVKMTLEKLGFDKSRIDHWCIHPGGRKILEACESNLELAPHQLDPSRKVLSEYGNMSSASVLFVLKELWENEIDWSKQEKIFATGFGPGLTMETTILSSIPSA